MLTIEYRVNGQLVGFTNIHNICSPIKHDNAIEQRNKNHKCRYEYQHRSDKSEQVNTYGQIEHNRHDGFEKLALKVLMAIKGART